MARNKPLTKPSLFSDCKSFFLAALTATLLVCAIWSLTKPWTKANSSSSTLNSSTSNDPNFCNNQAGQAFNRVHDPPETTFYDDPQLSYTLGTPIENWDRKRKLWLKLHPTFSGRAENRILIVTGSQPAPCKNPIGDHLLLRCFKNKADYSRIHGYDIFYNTACLDPKMCNVWAKVALVRAAMVAHPEAEWIWWMDSDAIFTDMYFKVPLQKYNRYNLIVPGWPDTLYQNKSWVSVNTGSFLMRNCQWSLDFLDVWASMSPRSPDYNFWGETLMATLSDKTFPGADEQSSLVYILLKGARKWKDAIHLETEYDLSSYWVGIIGKINEYSRKYNEIQRNVPILRRRRAEAVSQFYGSILEQNLAGGGDSKWPFITHFTGCQPCNGNHDPSYVGNSCWIGMERALNFADNQVLQNYGFEHGDLNNGSFVSPLRFAFRLDDNEFGKIRMRNRTGR
ncbi:OLC1v1011430C1 [Oldenlandia corymbosa var. corymbosa]|uniref:OLC1v1011430C1 n=1 Tax=Oldenlandia corymbosa var. corymbosa TaxID=529605 RepID=A0AAV1DTP1_OLDCO|nr:OLC1v1011430C1 [Oldenlandia corymbosa var. corymbosa]